MAWGAPQLGTVALIAGLASALGFAGMPLGWLIGAAIGTAAAARIWAPVRPAKWVQSTGLLVIGASTGLSVDPAILDRAGALVLVMFIVPLLGAALALLGSAPIARWSGVHRATAYFALLPGGIVEMSTTAPRYGGDGTAVAVLHALRVILIALVLPLVALVLGFDLMLTRPETTREAPGLGPIATLAIGAVGALLGKRIHLPATWLIGPILAVGAARLAGLDLPTLPTLLIIGAQIALGIVLGARVDWASIGTIRPLVTAVTLAYLGLVLLFAAIAIILATLLDMDGGTLLAGLAPGGAAEMVLLGGALGADLALVATIQVARSVMVNLIAGWAWRRSGAA